MSSESNESSESSKIIDITDDMNIEDILKSTNKYILLYFTASWCGPCKSISPIIYDKFSKINNLKIYKVDIDDNEELCAKYDIKSVPTFHLIYDGETKMNYTGANAITLLKNINYVFNIKE